MPTLRTAKGEYRVSDFLSWQREGVLVLSPDFQRRSVWKKGPKSFLIDTMLKGLPIPIIFLRDKPSTESILKTLREVVDGQQRLRTILSYISPESLPDFDDRDRFVIERAHNEALAGRSFSELPREDQRRLLDYEFSVHTLPADTGDKLVLQMFARMNSSGYQLNAQELRNAEYYGFFKTIAYDLATEQLDRWRHWGVFDREQIARMLEVELMSEFMVLVVSGSMNTSKSAINATYGKYEESFPSGPEMTRRIRRVFEEIDNRFLSDDIKTLFSGRTVFYGLFATLYGLMYGLTKPTPINREPPKLLRQTPKEVPKDVVGHIAEAGRRILHDDVPEELAKGLRGATKDPGRRRELIGFLAGAENDPCQGIP